MSFPIKILRGHKPPLSFQDLEALRAWLVKEETVWIWLLEENWEKNYSNGIDRALAEEVINRQFAVLQELKGLISESIPTQEEIDRAASILQFTHNNREQGRICHQDLEAEKILQTKENPAFALGMLAQALDIPIREESSYVFSGRHTWLNQLSGIVMASLQSRLAQLDESLNNEENKKTRQQSEYITQQVLKEIKKAMHYNIGLVIFFLACSFAWIFGAYHLLKAAHIFTLPGEIFNGCQTIESAKIPYCQAMIAQSSHLAWRQWGERIALYFFVIAAFSWGMRWLGFMILEAWAASQSGPPHSECIADKRHKWMFAPAANLLSTIRLCPIPT